MRLYLKETPNTCFPVKFTKFLRTPFLQNTTGSCFCKFCQLQLTNMYCLLKHCARILVKQMLKELQPLHKKWSFPLRISSVNVTKSAVSSGFVTFTEAILNGKLHFLCSEPYKNGVSNAHHNYSFGLNVETKFVFSKWILTILAIIFWDILMFEKFSCHHKWNKSWLFVINMTYKSCLTSCRTT